MRENENVSRTFATFRLWARDLNPDDITQRFRLSPTWAFRRGDKRGQADLWPHGYWEISSQGEVNSTNVALHIEWLLERIEPVREALESMRAEGVQANIVCFWESLTGHGGPIFSPHLMARLAALNLELALDIYFAS